MLKRYMHKRERHLAMLNDNRTVRPFEWGTEFIGHERDAEDPHELFSRFSRETIENSDEYFAIPTHIDFTQSEPSAVAGGSLLQDEERADRLQPPATADGSDLYAIGGYKNFKTSPKRAAHADSSWRASGISA